MGRDPCADDLSRMDHGPGDSTDRRTLPEGTLDRSHAPVNMARMFGRTMVALCTLVALGGACGEPFLRTSDAPGSGGDTAAPDAEGGDASDETSRDTSSEPAPWYRRAVMYEVMVRSFQDSDGDGIGDLPGLLARLDYLNDGAPGGDDLGVDGLWLMPIFAAGSYHGYDTMDYRTIDPAYGTTADLDALVAACRARGIHVVLDLVLNHTSRKHPWFVAASASTDDPRRDWYLWRDENPGWLQPFGAGSGGVWHRSGGTYYYGLFSGEMPDLNLREPAVVAELTDVARSWLGHGVAGFRLDAARYLVESESGALADQPETHTFWQTFRATLATTTSDVYLVGEVWSERASVATYAPGGDELHQAFDFDLQYALRDAASNGRASTLQAALQAQEQAGTPWGFAATFVGNHDLARVAGSLSESGQRAATFLLLTLPGTPYLYYGDELGLGPSPVGGDRAKRGPMAWDAGPNAGFTDAATPWNPLADDADRHHVAAARADPASLWTTTRDLIALRHAHSALAGDGLRVIPVANAAVFAMVRHDDAGAYLALVNLGASTATVGDLDVSRAGDVLGAAPVAAAVVFGSGVNLAVQGWERVSSGSPLAPGEGRVVRLR